MPTCGCRYINGSWVGALDGAVVGVTDPATGNHIINVPDMTEHETNAAIDAAHAAGPGWAGLLAKERSAILHDWYVIVTGGDHRRGSEEGVEIKKG